MTVYNRYIKLRKAIRYPDGSIEYVVPFEEMKGEFVSQSDFEDLEDCLYDYIYRWNQVALDNDDPNTYICEGYAQYFKEVYQKSTDGINWSDVEPKQERKGKLISEYSESCGYVPLTKWVIIQLDKNDPNAYLCEDYSLYQIEREYISYDNGSTYIPTDNIRKYKLIEENSEVCKNPQRKGFIIGTYTTKTTNGKNILITDKQEYFDYIIYNENETIKDLNSGSLYHKTYLGENVFDFYPKTNLTTCESMFAYVDLNDIDFINYYTTNITNMNGMFKFSKVSSLNLSKFDTSNVTNMHAMFHSCEELTSLDLSSFDTSNVTDMSSMFSRNYLKLTSINISSFNTSQVTNMESMFDNCSVLISIDVSNFDTSNVTNMRRMFFNCRSFTTLDVSSFDTSNVTNMESMFQSCEELTSLDLSNFNTSKVTNVSYMFGSCYKLETLDLSNFDVSNFSDFFDMLVNCYSLTHIKCKKEFKDLCMSNIIHIGLPESMWEGGTGTWEIVG